MVGDFNVTIGSHIPGTFQEFQESYNTWVDEADNAMKQVEKIKTKNSRKDTWKI